MTRNQRPASNVQIWIIWGSVALFFAGILLYTNLTPLGVTVAPLVNSTTILLDQPSANYGADAYVW